MRSNRRDFLKASAALAAIGLTPLRSTFGQEAGAKAPAPLKLLILGGTGFLGPQVVERAIARGHTMTLFNRGKTNPSLFPDLEKLQGNRNGKLEALEGRKFDAVIDTSGYVPRHVKLSAELLAPNISHYLFVSTISVYKNIESMDTDESSPLETVADETIEKVTGETYGALKALCEQAAEKAMPGKVSNVRPGLIVGPGDDSDRFTYWPMRIRDGGEVLCPGSPDHTTQFIDVRDLANFIIHCIEAKHFGAMNALGPKAPMTFGDFLDACKKEAKSDATLTWCDTAFLAEQKVAPWGDMPMWIPPAEGKTKCAVTSNALAMSRGLEFRPVGETIAATYKWFDAEEGKRPLRAGIKRERETEVLAAWKAREKK